EFFGPGTTTLALPDRATIANMAPEYGATMGFFPVDDKTIEYFKGTGRKNSEIEAFEAYFKAQALYGIPQAGDIDYSSVVTLDLGTVTPSLAGPKRPQDRIELGNVKSQFINLYSKSAADNGFNQPADKLNKRYSLGGSEVTPPATPAGAPRQVVEMESNRPTLASAQGKPSKNVDVISIGNGDVLIAAITSCTNTSNPSVLLAAGLLAKKAVEAGLTIKPHVKTSLAPGSRVVTEYLEKAG
ncbi:MAG: aconitase family protein, partial [Pseudomonadota bacterium]